MKTIVVVHQRKHQPRPPIVVVVEEKLAKHLVFNHYLKSKRELLNGRKVHRVKRSRGQGFYEHQVSSQPPVNKNGLPNRLVNHNHNWEQDAETYQDQESIKSNIQIQKSLKENITYITFLFIEV